MPISPKVPYKDRKKWEKTSYVNPFSEKKKEVFQAAIAAVKNS